MMDFLDRLKMCDIRIRVSDHGHHPPQDGTVSTKKIDKRNRQHQYQTAQKTSDKEQYLGYTYQLLIVIKAVSLDKIKNEENDRYDGIINTIL